MMDWMIVAGVTIPAIAAVPAYVGWRLAEERCPRCRHRHWSKGVLPWRCRHCGAFYSPPRAVAEELAHRSRRATRLRTR